MRKPVLCDQRGDLVVARATIEGKLALPSEAPLATSGRMTIDEPGAPTKIDYDVQSGDRGVVAEVSSLTQLDGPRRLRELSGARVRGEVASRARYDAVNDQVDAELRVNLTDIRHPQLDANRFDVAAHARGRASEPHLELLANLTGVRSGNRSWSRLRVHALGTSEEVDVRAQAYGNKPDRVELHAVVAPGSASCRDRSAMASVTAVLETRPPIAPVTTVPRPAPRTRTATKPANDSADTRTTTSHICRGLRASQGP